MKNLFIKYKKKFVVMIILAIILIVAHIAVAHDYKLYNDSIIKIIQVSNRSDGEKDGPNGEKESYYIQEITGKVMNGIFAGKTIEVENSYSYSRMINDKYAKGMCLFVSITNTNGDLSATISGEKRDTYVVMLLSILTFAIIVVAGIRGVTTLLSLGINVLVVAGAFYMYEKGTNILQLCIIMLILFGICSLLLANGLNKQTIIAILASALSVAVLYGIYYIVFLHTEEPEYLMQQYISGADDLPEMFLTGTLIGGFGAILDVAISMATSINEVVKKTPTITTKELVQSMREIAYDVMGTMINVLFFTYISGCMPMLILRFKNDFSVYIILKFYLTFEILRFLVGSIGIVLTIPISGVISLLAYKRKGIRND